MVLPEQESMARIWSDDVRGSAQDEEMSSHFGKAEWIMVADAESGVHEFVKNVALNGKGAVEIVIRRSCTDVILADIGDGALGHLQAAHIRAWALPNPSSEAKHSGCSGRGNYLLCLRHAQQRDRVRTMGFAAPAQPEQKLPSVAVVNSSMGTDRRFPCFKSAIKTLESLVAPIQI